MKPILLVLTLFIAFAFPHLSLGQAPNLGTASNYALFTVVGAFSNNGGTLVKGNIGTNSGALTGFPPGEVMGETHVADASSLQTANDVTAAYAELTAAGCTAPISASIGGLTLTAGVYCQSGSSASDLTGVLTLDGQGNPNAVFIIKLTGALSTATGSSIVLINGASFENVYFQVNGAVNLGIGSVFKGTILANGAISLLTGASLQGRGLSIAGEINLDANKVNITPDLVPTIATNSAIYVQNQQRDMVITITNASANATTAPVEFEISKVLPAFGISISPDATTSTVSGEPTVANGDWTITEQGGRFVLRLKDGLSIPGNSSRKVVIQITASTTAKANARITVNIFLGTGGGETPTTNDTAIYGLNIE